MIKNVLIPKTIWSLRLSGIEEESVSAFRDTEHMKGIYKETHAYRLIIYCFSRLKKQCVLVIDNHEKLIIRISLDSEWTE